MKIQIYLMVIILGVISISAYSDSIEFEEVAVLPGGAALIPVNISSATDIAGINISMKYDSNVFSSPAALRNNTILQEDHDIHSYIPQDGEFFVTAYSPLNALSFTEQSGTVFTLSLEVDPAALYGTYVIDFATSEIPLASSSGLSGLNGNSIEHERITGIVSVQETVEPTNTPTSTPSNTPTQTHTFTPTWTPTQTATPTETPIPLPTYTPTPILEYIKGPYRY